MVFVQCYSVAPQKPFSYSNILIPKKNDLKNTYMCIPKNDPTNLNL